MRKKVRAQAEVRFQNKSNAYVFMRKGETKEVEFDTVARYLSLLRKGVFIESQEWATLSRRKLPDITARVHKQQNRTVISRVKRDVKIDLREVDLSERVQVGQGSPK
jgi:hypothetical protein